MLLGNNIKMAIASLRTSRWRSLLTMLGIIIGVTSVVTTVSIGEGVRQQIAGQINHLGNDLITVRAGKSVTRDKKGNISNVNLLTAFGNTSLSEADYNVIRKVDKVSFAVPFNLVAGIAKTDEQEYSSGFIVATTEKAPDILNQKVQFGAFFTADESSKQFAVIGQKVAQDLFKENVPVGKSFQIRGQRYIVHGVFEQFDTSPLAPNSDYNSAIFIPFEASKQLTTGQTQIYQVLVKPDKPIDTDTVASSINKALLQAHGNQDDFTVLKQQDTLAIANKVFKLLTSLIAGVAAISLVVGGIGIMNIMLVSVTERTREIGVRKAVGATNRQILSQFITEAAVLSFMGGLIGVFLSIVANYFIRIFTDLQPVITLPIMGVAVGVALVVGIFFGMTPALKAAKKDPIDALRYE